MRLPHASDLALPEYHSALAAGLDLLAAVSADAPVELAPGARAMIPTGVAIALPPGHEGQVRPRSGLAARHGVTVLNSPGTVDADYRGEVQVILINLGAEPFMVHRGMRIAQLIIAPIRQARLVETDSLEPTSARPAVSAPPGGPPISPKNAINGFATLRSGTVHDLDSFGAIPLESKVKQFAGALAMDPLAMAVTASRGKRGMPDTIRRSGGYARPWRGGFPLAIGALAPLPARADGPPTLALHELVLGASRSIDRHEVAVLVLLVGLLLFAVVTAILLLQARAGWARLEASSRDEIAMLRADLDRANALLLSEPQVMVEWLPASDEPSIEGDPAVVGVSVPRRVLAFGTWLDAARATAMEQAVDALRARGEAFSMAFTTLSGRPVEAQGRAVAGRAVLRLKDASGVKRELLDLAGRHEGLLREIASLRALIETLAIAGVDTRCGEAADLRQSRLRACGRSARCRRCRRAEPGTAGWLGTREHYARPYADRRLYRPAARRRRRSAEELRRPRLSHRDRQCGPRHRRHRSRNDAQRGRPHGRRAPPHARSTFDRRRHV